MCKKRFESIHIQDVKIMKKRNITDMAGRKVTVPEIVNKAIAPSPYGSTMLYSVAPEKTAGFVFPLKEEDKKYLDPCVHNLPVTGRLSENTEDLMKTSPDLIIVWGDKNNPFHKKSENILNKLDLPFVYVTVGDLADLVDYPAAYEFLGKLLNKEEHTAKEADYCRKTLQEISVVVGKIPVHQRPKVYYAEGENGLCTECDDSLHVHLLRLAGDVNIHRGHTSCHMGMEKVSIDQVLLYNPDVILVQNEDFFNSINELAGWRNLKAVKTGKVFLIPKRPFNWFDRPPSFMRILGIKWVTNCLYPEEYKIDIIKEALEFYDLFLNVKLDVADAAALFKGRPL
jgi:iron complex transport system substrate-binding protein